MTSMSRIRRKKGALQAEWAMTMYVLFLFMFFPMMDYAVLGLRTFFLWFACNQATMIGSKAHTLVQPVTIGASSTSAGTTYQGALKLANQRAQAVATAFPGVQFDTTKYPSTFINFVPLSTNPPAKSSIISYPPSGAGYNFFTTTTSPITTIPDQSLYVSEFKCVMVASISPFITIPLIGNVPGLSTPVSMSVESQAQFENPPGLTQ
jgi:hypothetical protein